MFLSDYIYVLNSPRREQRAEVKNHQCPPDVFVFRSEFECSSKAEEGEEREALG